MLPLIAALLLSAAPESAPRPGFVEVEVKDVVQLGDSYAVLLAPKGEKGEPVLVPIFIGEAEGRAIALKLARQTPPRPLTHDLLDTVIRQLGATVLRIEIDDLKNETYLGKVVLKQGAKVMDVDSRPSDAIALALRAAAPIHCARKVIERAGVTAKDLERKKTEPAAPQPPTDL